MGLDMYLYRQIYIGAQFECNEVVGTIDIRKNGKMIDVDLKKVAYIYEDVAYWRKANAIHRWFVHLVDGVDDCRPIEVCGSTLIELRKLCEQIMAVPPGEERDELARELLPPTEGFFFGSTQIDEGYYEDIELTIKQLADVKEDEYYVYRASW